MNVTIAGNKITYTVNEDAQSLANTLLYPNDTISYYIDVKVTESNMSLQTIRSTSISTNLTNVNHGRKIGWLSNIGNRVVYPPEKNNICKHISDTTAIKLKDLIIAGKVWLDENRDGYNQNEEAKSDVVVKLYRDNGSLVKEEKTRGDGLYTFDRQPKTNKYYVEFEYDGVMYKATEVYGGVNTGNTNGQGNLTDPANWRQGYAGLPGNNIAGNTDYMIDSNAYEFDDVRNNFDTNHQTIGYNKAYRGFESVDTLTYTKSSHKSTLNEDPVRVMTARSFITQNYSTTVNKDIKDTNTLYLAPYNGYSNPKPETEYLKFINLGLVKREEVDLSIEADVYSVKTTINGENMTYDFNKNTANSTDPNYGDGYSNAYHLADDYYNLNLYGADFDYRNDMYYKEEEDLIGYKANDSELNVQVTYKITLHNNEITNDESNLPGKEDIPINAAVNEVAIYYDANFMTYTGTFSTKEKNDDTGILYDQSHKTTVATYNGHDVSLNNSSIYNDLRNNLNGQYGVLYLRSDDMNSEYIEEGDSRDIYITFTVDKDSSRKLKIGDLKMVAEISAYTTKYKDDYFHKGLAGQFAGLVDRDSNPGNIDDMGKYSDYEDDTYKTNINIKVPRKPGDPGDPGDPELKRTISGIVWDDARSEKIGEIEDAIQYLGNGEYKKDIDGNLEDAQTNPNYIEDGKVLTKTDINKDSKDKPVAGVKVSLIEVIQTQAVDDKGNAIYYEYPARNSHGKLIESITNENGEYMLDDFIPGYYKVRFDYGYDADNTNNILYNGQDYKSTTYYNKDYYGSEWSSKDYVGEKNNNTYYDNVKTNLSTANYSDAQDDEIRRLNVNSYSETMTTAQAKLFSEPNRYKEALTKNTHMYADSTIFYVKPEQVNSAIQNIAATTSNFDNTRLWQLPNLDFGLEYRPEASIILDKDIATLELVTSDNETLVKLYFEEDGAGNKIINKEKSIGLDNTQFLQNTEKAQQGFVYVNMDADILEGCTIKVEYKMDAENNSEVDRINKNLDEIKYEANANAYGSTYKVYLPSVMDENEFNYNANGTAAEFLAHQYYNGYNFNASTGKETYKYLTKLKKSYIAEDKTKNNGVELLGKEYYGMYLGQTYYTGKIGTNDAVAQLKVDSILDYIDNDFTFSSTENSTENRLWKATTSAELKNVLDWEKVKVERDEDGDPIVTTDDKGNKLYNLVDRFGIRYDTENRTNLALSVDDNKQGTNKTDRKNVLLSRFLNTKHATKDINKTEEYTGTISAVATKVLSPDDLEKGTGLSYENIAEVVQYTSLTGRRTTLPDANNGGGGVIANANVDNWNGYNEWEDDTDATEVITISPPTGLTK